MGNAARMVFLFAALALVCGGMLFVMVNMFSKLNENRSFRWLKNTFDGSYVMVIVFNLMKLASSINADDS